MSKPNTHYPNVVALNGPPRSGKDTGARILQDSMGAHPVKLAAPIRRALAGFFEMTEDDLEFHKPDPITFFENELTTTYRQAMISFSEDWVKPKFGDEMFGLLAMAHMSRVQLENAGPGRQAPLFVISDSGFLSELRPVVRAFGVENVLLVHLFREGCSFDGDSRSYVHGAALGGVFTHVLANDGTEAQYGENLTGLVQDWRSGQLR